MLKISVVICTYNRAAYLPEAMESLLNQTLPADEFEVIIVNNNSTDNTEDVCRKFIAQQPAVAFHYYNEARQGASFARNNGAAKASAPLLCFMDDDAVAEKDYLQHIVSFFASHPHADGLGGRIIPRYIPAEPTWMSHYVSSLVGNFDYSKEIVEFSPSRYPLESNMIVKKADFDEVGGFNADLPGVVGTLRIGGEGKDFFFRLKAKGKKIYYSPNVVVHHVVEVKKLTKEYMYRVASGVGRGERTRVLAISRFAFLKKNIEYFFKLGASVLLGIKYIVQGTPAKARPVIQFRIDAIKGLWNF